MGGPTSLRGPFRSGAINEGHATGTQPPRRVQTLVLACEIGPRDSEVEPPRCPLRLCLILQQTRQLHEVCQLSDVRIDRSPPTVFNPYGLSRRLSRGRQDDGSHDRRGRQASRFDIANPGQWLHPHMATTKWFFNGPGSQRSDG